MDKVLSSVSPLLNSSEKEGLKYLIKSFNNDVINHDNDYIQELLKFKSSREFMDAIKSKYESDTEFNILLSRSTKKSQMYWNCLKTMTEVIGRYGEDTLEEYWIYLIKEVQKVSLTKSKSRSALFYDLPSKLISKYGALDAILTAELYEFNLIVLKSDSAKFGIDLNEGYKLFLRHQYLAMIFGSNGMYWDEDRVLYYENLVMNEGKSHLIEMLKFGTPFMMAELKSNLQGKMLEYDTTYRDW